MLVTSRLGSAPFLHHLRLSVGLPRLPRGADLSSGFLERAMRDAGHYSLPLVWALDRLAREGPLDTLQVVDRFATLGVQVVSHQEPWTEASGELRDLLLAIVGWVARFESARRSERTKAGLDRV